MLKYVSYPFYIVGAALLFIGMLFLAIGQVIHSDRDSENKPTPKRQPLRLVPR